MTRKFPTALLRPLAQQAFIGLLDTTPLAEGIPDYPPAHGPNLIGTMFCPTGHAALSRPHRPPTANLHLIK